MDENGNLSDQQFNTADVPISETVSPPTLPSAEDPLSTRGHSNPLPELKEKVVEVAVNPRDISINKYIKNVIDQSYSYYCKAKTYQNQNEVEGALINYLLALNNLYNFEQFLEERNNTPWDLDSVHNGA